MSCFAAHPYSLSIMSVFLMLGVALEAAKWM